MGSFLTEKLSKCPQSFTPSPARRHFMGIVATGAEIVGYRKHHLRSQASRMQMHGGFALTGSFWTCAIRFKSLMTGSQSGQWC
jgi:hypothetical protein